MLGRISHFCVLILVYAPVTGACLQSAITSNKAGSEVNLGKKKGFSLIKFLFSPLIRLLVGFANSGMVLQEKGVLKLPPGFTEKTFHHMAKQTGLWRQVSSSITEEASFTDICTAFLQKGCFSAWCRVLEATLNLRVLINPVDRFQRSSWSPSGSYLILHEAAPRQVAMETVIYVNGIQNTLADALYQGWFLSRFCGVNVLVSYNSSCRVALKNLARGFLNAKGFLPAETNPAVRNLKEAMRLVLILNRSEPSMLFAHSDGTSVSKVVFRNSAWKTARHFHYFACGPASVLEPRGFLSSFQVVSSRDPITLVMGGRANKRSILSFVPATTTAPFLDHPFLSPTYFRHIEKFVENFRGLSYE
ncbi:hypothetical protein [Candidatus Similichlamydia laticola]|uniref:Uncharacterized protein n=1 Tax=Candidatus Similichlamydia laticola TaxID=2170265 RepID=A0A369KE36_9BACT|nr:hypothetical protein [Candidatus Similichlamydia laticola]RDB31720.1 hypothetical protein HAT2_00100 [Candidatus Similichlamydia laticola]